MRLFSIFLLLLTDCQGKAQNLPSLLTGRNLNATFSITAYDSAAQEWGVAVATNNIYVGNSTIYIQPGLGAFSVIAETEPLYAINGFDRLKKGNSIKEAIEYTMKSDSDLSLRQVGGVDREGNSFAFTGSSWKYEKGVAGSLNRKGYIVMGNQLADKVLETMAAVFDHTPGTLARRLLAALLAGEQAGGQITGKQSSALVVKGSRNEWYNDIDLRVDNSRDPFGDLRRLLNYHYGRIRLNQATTALRMGNLQRGISLLKEAERLTEGWNGLAGKTALAWLLSKDSAHAIALIRAALRDNPRWKENLPAFYLLRDHPGMKGLIDESYFQEKDWIAAASVYEQLGQPLPWETCCRKALTRYPGSSYLSYKLAGALLAQGKKKEAKEWLEKSIRLDPSNAEAAALTGRLR